MINLLAFSVRGNCVRAVLSDFLFGQSPFLILTARIPNCADNDQLQNIFAAVARGKQRDTAAKGAGNSGSRYTSMRGPAAKESTPGTVLSSPLNDPAGRCRHDAGAGAAGATGRRGCAGRIAAGC
jgi:hypothetical protein